MLVRYSVDSQAFMQSLSINPKYQSVADVPGITGLPHESQRVTQQLQSLGSKTGDHYNPPVSAISPKKPRQPSPYKRKTSFNCFCCDVRVGGPGPTIRPFEVRLVPMLVQTAYILAKAEPNWPGQAGATILAATFFVPPFSLR
jgi:hypothetical protein